MTVVLSKFGDADVLELTVVLGSGASFTHKVNASDPSMERVGDPRASVWRLSFAGLPEVTVADLVSSFSIRANDNNPSAPKGTAEHFLISALEGETVSECAPGDLRCCDPATDPLCCCPSEQVCILASPAVPEIHPRRGLVTLGNEATLQPV